MEDTEIILYLTPRPEQHVSNAS